MSERPRPQDWLEYGLVRLAQLLDRLLGPGLSGRLAAALGRWAYRPLGIRARVVDEQLRHAFPDRDDGWRKAVARQSYEHLGREAMSILRLSRLGRADVLAVTEVRGLEELENALEAGRGAILFSGHYGNWEMAGASLTARGIDLDVVAVRQRNRLVDRLMRETRERLGMRVIYRGGSTRKLLKSLREGRAVALVADQDARSRGVFVPFFGRLASTHRGPALLAARTGAPVFTGFATRLPNGEYVTEFRRVPVPEDVGERVDVLIARVTAALEAKVRETPGQYFWQHRRWKTQPPEREGGSGGYQAEDGSGAEATGVKA